jgi:hypothetical protein
VEQGEEREGREGGGADEIGGGGIRVEGESGWRFICGRGQAGYWAGWTWAGWTMGQWWASG